MPKPYLGQKEYIFISYAHKDTEEVFWIIAYLQEKGFRIWYDEGIVPGTEWDKNIADHIDHCSYFIAFLSESYIVSENCKMSWLMHKIRKRSGCLFTWMMSAFRITCRCVTAGIRRFIGKNIRISMTFWKR